MTPAIAIKDLIKDFRIPGSDARLRAVDGLNLTIEREAIYGLLGPNGSGKSTTIKVLLGLLKASAGNCELFGTSSENASARIRVGYLPEAPYFQRFLTGRELLEYFGCLSGLKRAGANDRIDELLERVGLEDAGDRRVGSYSKGMLQRIGLAQALIADPDLLILDEPTAGVDPIGAADIASLITGLKAEGKTVLLCSHLLSQVEAICDRVAIMSRGRLLCEGTVASLTENTGKDSIRVDGLSKDGREAVETLANEQGGTVSAPSRSLEDLFLELARNTEDPL
ncbi:MAG: ABC transporter ATP-binding protein [Opitutales bacterium]|jgi:ABC-2 type transport system ATP-binding protein|nr:ABC transporter ATP-binding protein [Opitutales bacterium]MBT5170075.1 ABC transporter ATP-binding protein [Opitutales bacterium]MBT5815760.1 ABC transporter ATP-binding protein [Opitutales bacterium]MBT6379160.1 ABC transporter ATP-binding protein [Opitutales bacterium]MBT7864846.1 ABC transporter ATP-binding protein [Opitutales bacterium]